MSDLMKDKVILITGIANNKSIAYAVATQLKAQGATICATHIPHPEDKFKGRLQKMADEEGFDSICELDATSEESLANMTSFLQGKYGKIDGFLHSMAFATKEGLTGATYSVDKEGFLKAMDVSVYTLLAMSRHLEPILNDNSSILTLSYFGAEKTMPNYNVMGIAKAALEASVRYLALDLGKRGIRVNSISAGAIKTLAGSGITGFSNMYNWTGSNSLLTRNVSAEEVGKSGLYFMSDLASGVTAENHYVDSGYNKVGMPDSERG